MDMMPFICGQEDRSRALAKARKMLEQREKNYHKTKKDFYGDREALIEDLRKSLRKEANQMQTLPYYQNTDLTKQDYEKIIDEICEDRKQRTRMTPIEFLAENLKLYAKSHRTQWLKEQEGDINLYQITLTYHLYTELRSLCLRMFDNEEELTPKAQATLIQIVKDYETEEVLNQTRRRKGAFA